MGAFRRRILLLGLLGLPADSPGQQPPDPTAARIREEALRPNRSGAGRPLPLAGHWTSGYHVAGGFDPAYQMEQIAAGRRLLPWFEITDEGCTAEQLTHYEAALRRAAALRLPVSFLFTQWESSLYYRPEFRNLPPAENPNVVRLDGSIRYVLDPLGPVGPWRQAGLQWAEAGCLPQVQDVYPDPPLVLFVSNNEASRLSWVEVETSRRYVERYGLGRDANFKRGVVARGWIERYRALFDGIRAGLRNASWRRAVRFIGYGAFGPPDFGGSFDWLSRALPYDAYLDPSPHMWDGGSVSLYLHDWQSIRDDMLFSPQGHAQNLVPMQQEAWEINPDFWFEISVWDGEARKRQALSNVIPYTQERYGAMVQFLMLVTRPRLVREFRGYRETVANAGAWFDAVAGAVDLYYQNPTLERFWRLGELVANPLWRHPYQILTESVAGGRYAAAPRFFQLDSTLDPPHPYQNVFAPVPVFAAALQLGQSPRREWLVYAHAPRGPQRGVGITVPGFGPVWVDVPVEGAYYRIAEGRAGVETLDLRAPEAVSVRPSAGAGSHQAFTFTFRDQSGSGDLAWVQALITGTETATDACYLSYLPGEHTVFLFDDAAAGGRALSPGAGSIENSQCRVEGAGSSARLSGNELALTLDLIFKPQFAGPKHIFLQAQDRGGNTRWWVRKGTWTVTEDAPWLVALDPRSGAGRDGVFTLTVRDRQGGHTLRWVQLLVSGDGSGANACYVHYNRNDGAFFLFADSLYTGTWFPPLSGRADNSQCAASAAEAAVSGADLSLRVRLRFKEGFEGRKRIYAVAMDREGNALPGTLAGEWIVPAPER